MSILSWNRRGLGPLPTIQELCALVKAKSPSMVFLMETRRNSQRAMNLKWRLGLKHSVGVDSAGQGGGLVLFWHESLVVVLLGKSPRFIDVKIKDVSSNFWYRITFVYGEPRVDSRRFMWETLHRLRTVSNLPWLVLGDFNEAMWGFEHFSAHSRPARQMEDFRDVLAFCDLHDLGFCGLPYTWDNGRAGRANVRVRLDRAVADTAWRDVFTDAKVFHLTSSRSDHCPVLIETRQDAWERREQRLFRYELMRERSESLAAEIRKLWSSNGDRGNLGSIINTLSSMQGALRRWSMNHFGAVTEEISKLCKELDEAKRRDPTNKVEIRRIADHMDELLYHEEMMWLQQSRISWLREGDRNTRFFHMQAKWRTRKNKIKKMGHGVMYRKK
jgi:exonuclease III